MRDVVHPIYFFFLADLDSGRQKNVSENMEPIISLATSEPYQQRSSSFWADPFLVIWHYMNQSVWGGKRNIRAHGHLDSFLPIILCLVKRR